MGSTVASHTGAVGYSMITSWDEKDRE